MFQALGCYANDRARGLLKVLLQGVAPTGSLVDITGRNERLDPVHYIWQEIAKALPERLRLVAGPTYKNSQLRDGSHWLLFFVRLLYHTTHEALLGFELVRNPLE